VNQISPQVLYYNSSRLDEWRVLLYFAEYSRSKNKNGYNFYISSIKESHTKCTTQKCVSVYLVYASLQVRNKTCVLFKIYDEMPLELDNEIATV
jgi:hypothetical protein